MLEKSKNLILICALCMSCLLAGCTPRSSKNFETEEQAKEKCQSMLKEKYGKDFTISDGKIGTDKDDFDNKYKYYHATATDTDGLKAEVGLMQYDRKLKYDMGFKAYYLKLNLTDGKLMDTYSEAYYTKLTRESIEPLFAGEPFEKYYIELDDPHAAGRDLSLTADEYMKESGADYNINIVLKDGLSEGEYTNIIHSFFWKLASNQKQDFTLGAYAQNKEIYAATFKHSKKFHSAQTMENVAEEVEDGLDDGSPQPKEQYLLNDFYNGEDQK
jgi:hypothetical protein